MTTGARGFLNALYSVPSPIFSTATATLTVNLCASNYIKVDLATTTVNIATVTASNAKAGMWHDWEIKQHATTPRKITWPAAWTWLNGQPPPIEIGAAAITRFKTYCLDGTNFIAMYGEPVVANTDVDIATSPEIVDAFPDTLGAAVLWDVVIRDASVANVKLSQVAAVWNPATNTVNWTETTKAVIGTISCTVTPDITSDNVRLMATATTDNWRVQACRRLLAG